MFQTTNQQLVLKGDMKKLHQITVSIINEKSQLAFSFGLSISNVVLPFIVILKR